MWTGGSREAAWHVGKQEELRGWLVGQTDSPCSIAQRCDGPRLADMVVVVNIPAIVLCKCRTCATAFTIAAPVQPDADKERPGT